MREDTTPYMFDDSPTWCRCEQRADRNDVSVTTVYNATHRGALYIVWHAEYGVQVHTTYPFTNGFGY